MSGPVADAVPVPVPVPTEAAPEPGWRRLSPRMLLVHPVIGLGKAIPALIGLLFAGSSNGDGSLWGFGGAVAVIVYAVLRWATTRFRITGSQVELHHGVLHRITVTAPLDRVRTVDVTAHALHRLLGLAKVTIGTGTSDRKGRGGLVLDGLGAATAAGLRDELLHRGPALTPALTVDSREDELVRLDPRWLRYAPFTLSGVLTSVALLGLGWRVVTEGDVDVDRVGPLRAAGEQLAHWSLLTDIVVIALAGLLVVAVASTVGYALAFWNFRLTRHPGGSLHVARGLITTRATSIERARLRGLEISEPLLLRLVRGARLIAITTGLRVGHGAERGGELLLPPAPRDEAIRVADALLADVAPVRARLRAHPSAALRRRVLRAVVPVLALCAALALGVPIGLPGWVPAVALALVLPAVALARDRYRSLGHLVLDGYLITRYGSLMRRRSIVALDGIIGVNLHATFFQRRLGITTLTVTTAAGRQRYPVADVAPSSAATVAEAALGGLLEQFRAPGPAGIPGDASDGSTMQADEDARVVGGP